MRFISLASSSKANCYIVEHDGEALIIDAGLRKREMLARLREAGMCFDRAEAEKLDLDYVLPLAILVSHHHGDHAKYVGEISLSMEIPVWCSDGTLDAAPPSLLAKPKRGMVSTFPVGDTIIGQFSVYPVDTYHTPGAVGFLIMAGGRSVAVFTDVAELSGGVAQALERSNMACVEADYSESMLDGCDYDSELKRRIRLAHTSNEKLAALFANGFVGAALHTVVLVHLSVRANVGFIAEATVRSALKKRVELMVAPADGVLGPIEA